MSSYHRALQTPKPVYAEIVREALLVELEAQSDKKAVVLIAPSGYGKTTLLAQYARVTDHTTIWLTLERDLAADSVKLASVLAGLVRHALPGLDLSSYQEVWDNQDQGEALGAALATDLNHADENIRVILDDVHHLTKETSSLVEAFTHYLKEGHQLLLSGYDASHLRLAHRLARGEITLLGVQELTFTREETEVYSRARDFRLHEEAQSELEGWPVGLALAASGVGSHLSPESLVSESLKLLPEDIYSYLPAASCAQVWSEEIIRNLAIPLPSGWLSALRSHGLPLTPLANGMYRPHAVLRAALEASLERDRELYQMYFTRAAVLAEKQDKLMEAFSCYQKTGNVQAALRVAQEIIPKVVQRSDMQLALNLLESFDPTVLPEELLAILGYAQVYTGNSGKGERILSQLYEDGFTSPYLYWALASAQFKKTAVEALKILEEGLAVYPADLTLLRARTYVLSRLGRFQDALASAEWTLTSAHIEEDVFEVAASRYSLAATQKQLDNFGEVRRLVEQASRTFYRLGCLPYYLRCQTLLVETLTIQGHLTEAQQIVDAVTGRIGHSDDVHFQAFLVAHNELLFWRGEYQACLQDCEQLRDRVTDRSLKVALTCRQVELLARQGERGIALELVSALKQKSYSPLQQPKVELAIGIVNYHLNELEKARDLLTNLASSDSVLSVRDKVRVRTYLANIDFAQNQSTVLEQDTVEEFRQIDIRHILCADADYPWQQDANAGPGPAPVPEPGQDRIAINALGDFQVNLNGKQVKVPYSRSREILVWLALNGPSRREVIVDALWDGDASQRSFEYFKVSVRRLRVTLSEEGGLTFNPVLYEDGTYALSPLLKVELDITLLQRAVATKDEHVLKGFLGTQPEFLPNAQSEWVSLLREELNEALQTGLIIVADSTSADRDVAIRAAERAVEINNLSESAHYALVRTLWRTGNVNAAELAFRRMKRIWNEEFDQNPDRTLESLTHS